MVCPKVTDLYVDGSGSSVDTEELETDGDGESSALICVSSCAVELLEDDDRVVDAREDSLGVS